METTKPHYAVRLLPSLTDVAFLMPLAFLFLRMGGATSMLGDGDTGWHVRTGEWILANHRIPSQDIFSYTKAGQPWFAWEWLWDLAFAWLYQRGGMAAVVLASMLVICMASVLLFRLICRKCGNPLLSIGVMFFVTGASSIHWLARPHLFTLLFTVIFYSILERAKEDGRVRLLWWLPALTVIWTNMHGGFFVGIILAGAYAAGEIADGLFTADASQRPLAFRRSIPYLATATGCLAATLINPYSYHLHARIYEHLSDKYWYKSVIEFQSFDFHHPAAFYFEPMLVLGLAAAVWSLYHRQFVYTILLAGWAHLALAVVRNEPIYMMLVGPPVALMLQSLLQELPGKNIATWVRRWAEKAASFTAAFGVNDMMPRWHLTSGMAAGLTIALFYAPNAPAKCQAVYDVTRYPSKAIEVLRQGGSPKIIFADDEWGDYLIYRLYPENRVFIDGRLDFYGSKFSQVCDDVMNVRYGWEKILEKYHVNTILLSPNTALATTLKESRRWHPIYDDGVAIVFRANQERTAAADQVSAVSRDGKDRDRKITKSQTSDPTITKSNSRSEPS